jgi:hypothetical protein
MKYQHPMMLGQSSYPKDDALRMTLVRTERERAPTQNNNKAKPEQLKLNKTYLTKWLAIADS